MNDSEAQETSEGFHHLSHPLPPVFDQRSRILVLGSFPSVLSRETGFYYGNPQNRFWKVLARIWNLPEVPDAPVDISISAKRMLLATCGVALWDAVAECDIRGSSDATIRNVKPNNVPALLDECPIELIVANGRTAEALYRRHLQELTGRDVIPLPSTSPANAAWSLDRLVERWSEVLRPPSSPMIAE